jgi:alkanesulfonate monooxygenase SsuD/methylene tetrahydromethanopterin reductase-like flavin-dependent oxidoreductase (luciferase family)
MKFGVGIIGTEPPSETIKIIKLAEKLGYDFIWVPDEKFF